MIGRNGHSDLESPRSGRRIDSGRRRGNMGYVIVGAVCFVAGGITVALVIRNNKALAGQADAQLAAAQDKAQRVAREVRR